MSEDPAWKYGKKLSGTNRIAVMCLFCDKITKGGIFCHKQHLIGTYSDVARCLRCPENVREEIKTYVEGKKELKRQMLHQPTVTNLDDDDDETEEGEAVDLSVRSKSQKRTTYGPTSSVKGPLDCYYQPKPTDNVGTSGHYGVGMKPPTYHEVSTSYLAKEVEATQKIVEDHRVEWKHLGCSIMMDKWMARTGKMIINVLVNSPKGSLFLESIDASDSSTDSIKMFSLFQSTIEKIGPENVVQVITDNATENVKAGAMLKGVFPNIYWTPCAAHCINLMFGDIFKERPFRGVFTKAVRAHSYIVQRPLLLNMMRRFTKQKNLVKPGKTRFATAFLTLHRMHIQKANLRSLFISDEWNNSKFAKEVMGKVVALIMMSYTFWNNVVHALKIGGPLIKVLHLVDGEQKPPMGYLFEAMDRVKDSIRKSFSDPHKYAKVFDIIDKR
ncbi:uncharacterized protein LOC132601945 [Lycium barbarum]|uniref:uncharacterized protein LOC132601945 n=1 Tax=Lycium barbarum TaxID=112863 RepID=UPI00293F624D|nr:uncharacterized protein LOC132601945 [Lycium barbarum]